jgi:malate synthase
VPSTVTFGEGTEQRGAVMGHGLEDDSIDVAAHPDAATILTADAVAFVAALHRRFEPRRRSLLDARVSRQHRIDGGERPGFHAETAHIRSGDWMVAAPPKDLEDRRVEITAPVTREAMVAALNSGANVFMADFEDVLSPTWEHCIDGQVNVRDAYARTISIDDDGTVVGLGDDTATLVVRTRGWHLDERHFTVDGERVSASLFDFGLCVFHNARVALDNGTGPYFYLAKLESHLEARLWRDVFQFAENELGLDRGSIRATILIEHVLAAFEMDEILYELREHATGLHTGNWDYLFSIIKTFRSHPQYVLPDSDDISVTVPFVRAFTELLVSTAHRRGAHAIGGMSGIIPDVDDPERTEPALRKVLTDKRREAGDGFDGTRIANPLIVDVAVHEFDKVLLDRPNQVERQRDDVYVTPGDLLAVASTRGTITEEGVRRNVQMAIRYLASWLSGEANVEIDDHLEDTAMAELCRSQIWQWVRHRVELSNGRTLDAELIRGITEEETASLRSTVGDDAWSDGRFDEACTLFDQVVLADTLPDFLTIPAYELL